jgi:IS30 family transposase
MYHYYEFGKLKGNHEMIRRLLPKGSSFDHLEQQDIDLIICHINSYRHAKLNNKTPFEAFEFFYEKEPLEKLGYHSVANFFVLLRLFGTKNTLYGTCLFSFLLGQLY